MAKKYNIYGIGNALVDIEVEVSTKFLTDHSIEKGLMTLVEEDKQNQILNSIKRKSYNMRCGGSAANTVIAVSQMGGKSFYSCKVANDGEGEFYVNDLKNNGVDTDLKIEELPKGNTGKCLVMISEDAERTMNTYLGITSDYSVKEINEKMLLSSEYLYIEGYLITSENGREAMKKAKRIAEDNGVKVALTFSDPSVVKYFNDHIKDLVGASVDLLFCNEEEAMLFTGKDNLADAREALRSHAKKFAITCGKNGAVIFDGDTYIDIEPYEVKAVDSNGAGDMFAGAFMYAITNGHSYAGAGKLASMASSKVVSQFGPRLQLAQAKELINEFSKSK